MLAAIIANLQNVPQPQPSVRLPTVKIDRGGGGPIWPQAEMIDIVAALATFREIPGEHAPVRALRRYKHVSEALSKIKEIRENREASAFLIGVDLGRSSAIAEMLEAFDKARAEVTASVVPLASSPPPSVREHGANRKHERGDGGAGGAILLAAVVVGMAFMVTTPPRYLKTRRAR